MRPPSPIMCPPFRRIASLARRRRAQQTLSTSQQATRGNRLAESRRWCAVIIALAGLALNPGQAATQEPARTDVDPGVEKLVAAISEARLEQLVRQLASFGTRNTLSDATSPTRGIGAARQWILDELRQSSPRLQVSFDTHQVPQEGRITRPVELRNVVALLPGRSPRRIYVTAHYDSLNLVGGGQLAQITRPADQPRPPDAQLRGDQNYDVEAPGANDNGSGTALTMELARVLAESGLEFDATLAFVLWAGEEQGLIGSREHAMRLAADKALVTAVFNSDIVGNSQGGDGVVDAESVRVFSEGPEDSPARSIARYVHRTAALYVPAHRVRLMARSDRFGRSSDHMSFSRAGFPAVVFREANENFAKQHAAADTVDGVDVRYLARNARVTIAAVASLALAPPAPQVSGTSMIGRRPSGYDADLQWVASPGAAAYRVYWRDAWANDWQHNRIVGNVTRHTIPGLSIDDYVFGVAAIGADGHESAISAYVSR